MKFHITREDLKFKPIENEKELIGKLFYNSNEQLKLLKVEKKFGTTNEHEILNLLVNNEHYVQRCYLLFYHWYERKYQVNVIQQFNNILFNPIPKNSLIEFVRTRKMDLHDEIRNLRLLNLDSTKFKGYSVYFEYYHPFFPNIEKFTFKEFLGIEFINYLLDLFPHLQSITHHNGTFLRFSRDILVNDNKFNKEFGYNFLRYTNGLPNFFPRINDRILEHTHSPLSLCEKSIKDIENEIRDNKELPRIGEGWISEMKLFHEIKSHFNTEKVVHHGKPKWLGNQHVDIWLPKFKIGIEYQGKQHFEPIEFFGGEKSFIKNQERDERKKRLFKQNNSLLIEVENGYQLEEVIYMIENHIQFIN